MLHQRIRMLMSRVYNWAWHLQYGSMKHNTFSILRRRLPTTGIKKKKCSVVQIVGFTSAVVGVFGATNAGGLNFKMSPHYSSTECQENNLKAMIVAMMMHDRLDEDELVILMNSIEFVYQDSPEKRRLWCCVEMKNFMNCSEKFGNFQSEQCTSYRKMLKVCLQSKKGAEDFSSPKPTNLDEPSIWPYNPPGKYRPANLRKLPLSKQCPPSSTGNTGSLVSDDNEDSLVEKLNPCCEDENTSISQCTSSCRPCGCGATESPAASCLEEYDDRNNSYDIWQTTPVSNDNSDSNEIKEVQARRWIYDQSSKDSAAGDGHLDYEEWCRQQGEV